MMKSQVICFALIAIFVKNITALSDDEKSQIQYKFLSAGALCIADYSLTADDIASLKDKKLPDNDNAACFTGCIFKQIGLFDDKGTLAQEQALSEAKKVLSAEADLKNADELLSVCSKVNEEEVTDGEKGCDRAKLAFACLVDNHEKYGFNIDFNANFKN